MLRKYCSILRVQQLMNLQHLILIPRILGCYFHLTQSIFRKVNEIGMNSDDESDYNLRIAVRCLPALAMVPSSNILRMGDF